MNKTEQKRRARLLATELTKAWEALERKTARAMMQHGATLVRRRKPWDHIAAGCRDFVALTDETTFAVGNMIIETSWTPDLEFTKVRTWSVKPSRKKRPKSVKSSRRKKA